MLAKEVEAAFAVRLDQLLKYSMATGLLACPHRQKEVAAARDPRLAFFVPGQAVAFLASCR